MSSRYNTNRERVLTAVGLGRGALYHYIGSKEAILYEISGRQLAHMNTAADELALTESDAETRLRGLARALMRNVAEHRAEWTVFFREHHVLTGERRAGLVAERERYEAHWRDTLEQGVRDGRFRALPHLTAKGVLGMFNYGYLWISATGAESPQQIADGFLDAVITGMRAHAD